MRQSSEVSGKLHIASCSGYLNDQKESLNRRIRSVIRNRENSERAVLCVCAFRDLGKWPVVFSDTGPEGPDHYYGSQGEEGFEQPAVDGTVRPVADVYADHVLENLSNSEKQCCANQVHWNCVSGVSSQFGERTYAWASSRLELSERERFRGGSR